jgi:hypothetical protein
MKKNIDDLINNKFKYAEQTPPEEIWDSISAKLPFKKRNKRIIPIWYLIAGTAAVLAIMVLIFKDNSSPISNQKITNSPEKSVNKNNSDSPDVSKFQESEPESLFELKNDVVQTKIQKPETQNTKENQNNTIDKKSQISKDNEKNSPGSYTATELKNIEIESRTEESLNSDYKLSQLIQNDVEIVANDSITLLEDTIANIEDIEEMLNKKEVEESLKTSMSKRLSVTTTAGALYFDNLSGGSGIDEQFANNNSSSKITTSYGINFGYQISQKIKIRTGISQINLVSNTQNVAYFSLINSRVIEGSVTNNGNVPSAGNGESVFGKVNQNIGFIEVPSEVEYLIVNKKFSINLIGGFSTLFLNKNKISINTENSNTDLGKAKNLNEISFTANAGLGLNYKISPLLHFNIEPIFKYQLNTFKGTKNFNPYYFGIYSGFSFQF